MVSCADWQWPGSRATHGAPGAVRASHSGVRKLHPTRLYLRDVCDSRGSAAGHERAATDANGVERFSSWSRAQDRVLTTAVGGDARTDTGFVVAEILSGPAFQDTIRARRVRLGAPVQRTDIRGDLG